MAINNIIPGIFKVTDTEDYLEAAKQTASWISAHKVTDEHGTSWAVSCREGKSGDEVETTYLSNRTLYSGASGIGFFFLRLYEATGDKKYLEEAEAGAEYLISSYDPSLSIKPGLHTGTSGEGFFLINLYRKTNKKEYLDHAVRIADDIYSKATKEDGKISWNGLYDYMGNGSAVTYWIYVYNETSEARFLDHAKLSIDSILDLRIEDSEDTIHWHLLNVHDYFKEVPDNGIVANFAHGTSGIVYLLAQYYEASGDKTYLDYAVKGVNFLEKIAVKDDDSSIIPYIYLPDGDKPYDVYYLSLCHGPVGSAVVFKKLFKLTGDERYLEWIKRLNNALIKAGVPEKRSSGYWNNCICCGSSGILLHFISTDELLPGNANISLARRTANKLINDAYIDEQGRRWYDAWTRVKPWDVDSNLGLYIGDAGNASALLSLYASIKEIKLTELPEFA